MWRLAVGAAGLIALISGAWGVRILSRVFEADRDSSVASYLSFAVPLLVVAVLGVVFCVRELRSHR